MYGFGDLLRVDLTTETISRETIPLAMRRKYLGGEGINSRLLWEHFLNVDPRSDPRGPDNVFIVGLGPLGGTPFGMGSKTKFTFKSPAYNLFGDSVAGATFGAAMRWAGYDHLVITGRARRPVYLWIDDDRVELRDAGQLWGRNAHDTEHALQRELGDEGVGTACIGRAGENLVGFACITVGGHRVAGRTGGGCVMGSKNLKAIAARGTKGVKVADPAAFMTAMDGVLERLGRMPAVVETWRRVGTLSSLVFHHVVGDQTYRNGQLNQMPMEQVNRLNAGAYVKDLIHHGLACSPGCATACSAWHRVQGSESAAAKKLRGEKGVRPEFLAVAALGVGPDIPDLPAVVHLNNMCFDYSVDLLETGNAISFLMELWERRIVTGADLAAWLGEEGDLAWGNWEMAAKVIAAVGDQSCKLGQFFRDNVYRAAEQIAAIKGVPILPYVIYGKGGATFSEDPRAFPMWSCNMAVSARGADHLKGFTPAEKTGRKDMSVAWFGRPEAGENHGVTLKGAASARAENVNSALNASGICVLMCTRDTTIFGLETLPAGLGALTGLPFGVDDLYTMGERICNLEKAFNSRLGLRRQDDKLCERWMNEPAPQGPGKGMKAVDYLDRVLDEYYEYKGWDKATGLQRRAKLLELELADVADVLAQEGALVD